MNPDDDLFLEDLERRAFQFFWDTAHSETGLIPDRARADGSKPGDMASVAAVGFGLTALAIGAERGWVVRADAQTRANLTLRTLRDIVPHEHGFWYHFIDMATCARAWGCEASSIDTALGLFGALSVGRYFGGETEALAQELYGRVDWPWMTTEEGLICHGWTPEKGFFPWSWNQFSEHWGMTRLAMLSPTHPLPASAWNEWKRIPWVTYGGRKFLHHPPLFVHQFPQAWLDWRGFTDPISGVNFFENAREATLAQRQFCIDLCERFPGYDDNVWGLTSSDGMAGYMDWGGPPVREGDVDARIDGTVVPCAVAGSLPFAPDECLAALRTMHARFGEKVYGPYGFADAFNPVTEWVGTDVIGIDEGITLLMAENLRTSFVWKLMEPWRPL